MFTPATRLKRRSKPQRTKFTQIATRDGRTLDSRSKTLVFKPDRDQKLAVKFMVSRPAAGLLAAPGRGKTMCTYQTFQILRDLGYCNTLLVVTRLRPAYKVWPAEIEKWGLDLSCAVLHGKGKQLAAKKHDVYVINYEGLSWLSSQLRAVSKRWGKIMVAFDESSALRNTRSQRYKTVKGMLGHLPRRYNLTGSPTPKGLEGLFGQCYVLDNGERLGQYITHFRMKYFDQDPNSLYPKYQLKPNAEKKIYDAIKDLVIRFGDKDLPPRTDRTCFIDLPKSARLIYEDMERDLFTQIEGNPVLAKNVGVATQKLRQIVNGGLYYNTVVEDVRDLRLMRDVRKFKKLHEAKTEMLLELLDELEGQPTMVAYEFNHDLERLQAALPKGTPHIGTGQSIKDESKIMDAWNRGDVPVLLGQPQSMAHGVNLQETGFAVIWHSLTWDYEHYDQFIRRIWRRGQQNKIMVYHIVGRDTVDEAIMASLARKEKTQNGLFKALEDYRKQHLTN